MESELLKDAVEKARKKFNGRLSKILINFVVSSERGTCSHSKR